MHFIPEDRQRLHLFSPHSNSHLWQLDESMGQHMERLVPNEQFNLVQGQCLNSTRRNDAFIFAVAFVLCHAMGQAVSSFMRGLVEQQ